MAAWIISNLWDAKSIASYRTFVAAAGPRKASTGHRSTCEDLAIRLVTEFASVAGLPLGFGNNSRSAKFTPVGYSTPDEFLDAVLPSTAAGDLVNHKTAKFVAGATKGDPNSLRSADVGNLIFLYDPITHMQVVTAASSAAVKIAQGGFAYPRAISFAVRLQGGNANDPKSAYYIGKTVSEKSHTLEASSGKWLYDGTELFKNDHGRLMTWDFDAWNALIVKYVTKKGDDATAIAKTIYPNLNTQQTAPGVIAVLTTKGVPAGGPIPEGVTMYFWK